MVTHYLSSSGVLPYLSKLGYVTTTAAAVTGTPQGFQAVRASHVRREDRKNSLCSPVTFALPRGPQALTGQTGGAGLGVGPREVELRPPLCGCKDGRL